jgi:hypothetical protein
VHEINEADERANRHARRWVFILLLILAILAWTGAGFLFWNLAQPPLNAPSPTVVIGARWYDDPFILSEVFAFFLLGVGLLAAVGALLLARRN